MEERFRTAGIIAEFNPFHRGHRYLIEQTRRLGGADYVIVVMSGDFVQRGEPAMVDKYLRTRMALAGGADLVIELPTVYASASAEEFATAGVSILDTLGLVDLLSFGTEFMEAEELLPVARILAEEPENYRLQLREGIREGKSFPASREDALLAYLKDLEEYDLERIREMFGGPNHILGLEYLKALIRRSSSIEPMTVIRQGAGYHETHWDRAYPSASGIRRFLKENSGSTAEKPKGMAEPGKALAEDLQASTESEKALTEDLQALTEPGKALAEDLQALTGLDEDLAKELADRWRTGDRVDWADLMGFLDYQILYSDLQGFLGLDEELAARIKNCHRPGMSFEGLIEILHSRQRTDTSLKRALLHLVLQMGEGKPDLKNKASLFPYIRVLGFRKRAGRLLSAIRESCPVPILQRYADRNLLVDPEARRCYEMDIKCESLYEQTAARSAGRRPIHPGSRQQIII